MTAQHNVDNQDYPAPVSGKPDTVVLVLQEMLIDIFGIMIPGFCFIVLATVAIMSPLLAVRTELCCVVHETGLLSLLSNNALVIFATFLIFSFVAGHLLYRQNPKEPDQKSIDLCWKDISKSGCVRTRKNEGDEFPYGHLKQYLQERGFDELAALVPWTGTDFDREEGDSTREEGARKRSKHFINTIKLSIKHRDSRLYFDIQRNEAHVRLISSVWYGSRALIPVSGIGAGIGLVAIFLFIFKNGLWRFHYFEAVVLPILVAIAALAVIRNIERSFHYQRVREIVFVLQTWNLITAQARKAN